MWFGSTILEYAIYFPGGLEQSKNICVPLIHSCRHLGIWVAVNSRLLFTIIVVHPNNVHRNRCSSTHCSLKTLFKTPPLKTLTLFTFFILLILSLFIVHTNVNFFLFSKASSHDGNIVEAHVKC